MAAIRKLTQDEIDSMDMKALNIGGNHLKIQDTWRRMLKHMYLNSEGKIPHELLRVDADASAAAIKKATAAHVHSTLDAWAREESEMYAEYMALKDKPKKSKGELALLADYTTNSVLKQKEFTAVMI